MSHAVGGLLLVAGLALIVMDLVIATAAGERSSRIRLRLHHTLPHLPDGMAVVLVCTAGAAVFTGGLDLLSRT